MLVSEKLLRNYYDEHGITNIGKDAFLGVALSQMCVCVCARLFESQLKVAEYDWSGFMHVQPVPLCFVSVIAEE